MKAKLALVTLAGLTVCTLALAQNEPAATPVTEPAATPVVETPPAIVAEDPSATNVTAVTSPADAVIPLIQFQDVPLTTAIDNLARQAGINYILDPKVGYGQPDERGVIKTQPNISIRWENLTAAQALNALITTYGLQLTEDPKTKISRVTVKDPAAAEPLQTRIIQLKYAAPSNVLASVQTTFYDKRSKVVADVRTSQLVLSATEKELDNAEKLIEKLDLPTKQVLIEAKLIETSMNPSTIKGIDWSGTLLNQRFSLGNNSTYVDGLEPTAPTITPDPVSGGVTVTPGFGGALSGVLTDPRVLYSFGGGFNPATAFLNSDGVSAVLSFLNTSSDAKVIATPRAVTLDNETADLSVTRAHPIFKNTAGTQGSPGGSEVTYTNLGVLLKVTPRISANNFVNLRVTPEVSRVFTTVRKTVASTVNEADVYDIRKIDTQVLIPNANTLVLGGLVSDSTTKKYTKVPILGELPIIGLAFRQDSKQRDQNNLIIFITPTIVNDEDFHPTETDYLKKKPEIKEEGEWSWWDNGKPAVDWSKKEEPKYSE